MSTCYALPALVCYPSDEEGCIMKRIVTMAIALLLQCGSAMAVTPLPETDAGSASKTARTGKLSRVASGQTEQVPSPRRPQPVAEHAGRISPASRPTTDYAAVAASKEQRQATTSGNAQETSKRKPVLPDKTQ